MNTDIAVWQWSPSEVTSGRLREVERFFVQVERELSRFRPDSGLSRLNAAAGEGPQPVSTLLQTVLSLALRAAWETDGVFDPTVLHPLRRAGYDRTFEHVAASSDAASTDTPITRWGWQLVRSDPASATVELPQGIGLDLGGIAKGWTVDRAAEMLAPWGPVLVDAGGDIRAMGTPEGQPWPIAVEDPFDPARDVTVLDLDSDRGRGAVATSSIGGRRWRHNGQEMHHLIDPRTGKPSTSDLHTVVVVAPTATEAEVAAKVALILGRVEGEVHIAARGLSGLLIDREGHTYPVGSGLAGDRWRMPDHSS